ncbi:hypothetical protein VC77_02940, partial [Vibrio cholerae]
MLPPLKEQLNPEKDRGINCCAPWRDCVLRVVLSLQFGLYQEKRILSMANDPRKLLVTCALPYANGSIHLGHMLEHIQADIWVRYQRQSSWQYSKLQSVADDAHGTPIMLKAQ